ncbi:MAG: hypothetical protein KatS3mg110_3158 [Pirellulaceae bacterium]|nr:MAG: hypothetical protein KatS3mg110_3158 [Pirellulaceae bacterium]
MTSATFEQAEQWRKAGQYQEAAEVFRSLWEQQSTSAAAWRYVYCLRKLNRLEDAERVVQQASEEFPDDDFVRSEAAWVAYLARLEPAARQEDLPRVLEVAEQICQLTDSELLVPRVVMTVMKTAKKRGNWPVVLAWSGRITAQQLSAEPRRLNGKQTMAPREVWYINRARAMLEVGQYEQARQTALGALADFPHSLFLKRLAAQALAGQGNLAGAADEMRQLAADPRAPWYIEAELAELEHRAGNHQEAYRRMGHALLACRQSGPYKIGYFVSFSSIAIALDKPDVAAAHVVLARQIRTEQGWRIPQTLLDAEQQVRQYFQQRQLAWPQLPADSRGLEAVCRQFWQEATAEGLTFYRGTVKPFPEGRAFCYIRRDDGQGDVYALVSDLPREARRPGSRVEFALKASFDKKKQKPSVQATSIRPLPKEK